MAVCVHVSVFGVCCLDRQSKPRTLTTMGKVTIQTGGSNVLIFCVCAIFACAYECVNGLFSTRLKNINSHRYQLAHTGSWRVIP